MVTFQGSTVNRLNDENGNFLFITKVYTIELIMITVWFISMCTLGKKISKIHSFPKEMQNQPWIRCDRPSFIFGIRYLNKNYCGFRTGSFFSSSVKPTRCRISMNPFCIFLLEESVVILNLTEMETELWFPIHFLCD